MRIGARTSTFALLLALTPAARAQAQTRADTLPSGVTEQMITRGRSVFTGPGVCFACHGMAGEGVSGPSLADSVWLHSRGEYEKIVELIRTGVDTKASRSGVVMPPRGGSAISEADLRAVAAYVWSLGRRPASE